MSVAATTPTHSSSLLPGGQYRESLVRRSGCGFSFRAESRVVAELMCLVVRRCASLLLLCLADETLCATTHSDNDKACESAAR